MAPAPFFEHQGDLRGLAGAFLQLRQLGDEFFAAQMFGQGAQNRLFHAPPDYQIQVIRSGAARAQKLQGLERQQSRQLARSYHHRSYRHQFFPETYQEQKQAVFSRQTLPPGVEPLPGQKQAIGRRSLQQRVPLLAEIPEPRRLLDDFDRDGTGLLQYRAHTDLRDQTSDLRLSGSRSEV